MEPSGKRFSDTRWSITQELVALFVVSTVQLIHERSVTAITACPTGLEGRMRHASASAAGLGGRALLLPILLAASPASPSQCRRPLAPLPTHTATTAGNQ